MRIRIFKGDDKNRTVVIDKLRTDVPLPALMVKCGRTARIESVRNAIGEAWNGQDRGRKGRD